MGMLRPRLNIDRRGCTVCGCSDFTQGRLCGIPQALRIQDICWQVEDPQPALQRPLRLPACETSMVNKDE